MELIEIKEILRKASFEVDIQVHGKHKAIFEADFEKVAIELAEKSTIADVVVPKGTSSNLDEAIKKAKPNMDKIKDVDKHIDSIR